MEKLYVVKPGTNQLVAPEEWLKSEDPKSVEFLALMQDDGKALVFQKKFTDEEYKFDEAQKVAAKVKLAALPGVAFRCPTRKEFIDLYDSIKDGLIKILNAVGGKIFGPGQWFWTCEKVAPEIKEQWEEWFAQRSNVYSAWIFNGNNGYLSHTYVSYALQVGAVTLCSVSAEGDTLILKPLGEGAPAPSRAAQAAKKEHYAVYNAEDEILHTGDNLMEALEFAANFTTENCASTFVYKFIKGYTARVIISEIIER